VRKSLRVHSTLQSSVESLFENESKSSTAKDAGGSTTSVHGRGRLLKENL
jgi:hypothetical protein